MADAEKGENRVKEIADVRHPVSRGERAEKKRRNEWHVL
jgi:hypothetical protein